MKKTVSAILALSIALSAALSGCASKTVYRTAALNMPSEPVSATAAVTGLSFDSVTVRLDDGTEITIAADKFDEIKNISLNDEIDIEYIKYSDGTCTATVIKSDDDEADKADESEPILDAPEPITEAEPLSEPSANKSTAIQSSSAAGKANSSTSTATKSSTAASKAAQSTAKSSTAVKSQSSAVSKSSTASVSAASSKQTVSEKTTSQQSSSASEKKEMGSCDVYYAVDLINAKRKARGIRTLETNEIMMKVAAEKAKELCETGNNKIRFSLFEKYGYTSNHVFVTHAQGTKVDAETAVQKFGSFVTYVDYDDAFRCIGVGCCNVGDEYYWYAMMSVPLEKYTEKTSTQTSSQVSSQASSQASSESSSKAYSDKTETSGTTSKTETKQPENCDVYDTVDLINAERVKAGLTEYETDEDLMEIAAVRAKELSESFSHTRPDGTVCFTALSEHGYSIYTACENIAAGYSSSEKVVEGWMNSSGHRENILNEKATAVGVGFYNDNGAYYWVMLAALPA